MLSANVTFLALRLSSLSSSSTLSSESSVSSVSVLSSSSFMLSPFVSPAVLKSSSDSRRLSFLSCSTLRTFSSFLSVYGSSVSRLDIVRGDFVSSLSSVIQIHSNEVSELHLSAKIIDKAATYSQASVFVHLCTFRNIDGIAVLFTNTQGNLSMTKSIFDTCREGIRTSSKCVIIDSVCMTRNYGIANACYSIRTSEAAKLTNLVAFNCISNDMSTGDDLTMLFGKIQEIKYVNNTNCFTRDSTLCMLYETTTDTLLSYINCVNTSGNRCIENNNGIGLCTVHRSNFLDNLCSTQVLAVGSLRTHISYCTFFGNSVDALSVSDRITCSYVFSDRAAATAGMFIVKSTTLYYFSIPGPIHCSFTSPFTNSVTRKSYAHVLIANLFVILI